MRHVEVGRLTIRDEQHPAPVRCATVLAILDRPAEEVLEILRRVYPEETRFLDGLRARLFELRGDLDGAALALETALAEGEVGKYRAQVASLRARTGEPDRASRSDSQGHGEAVPRRYC